MTYRNTVGFFLLVTGLLLGCRVHPINSEDTPNVSAALPSLPVKVTNTSGEWLVYDLHLHTSPGSMLQKIDVLQGDQLLLTDTDFSVKDNFYLAHIWLPYPKNGWDLGVLANRFHLSQSGVESVETFP